MRLDGIETLNQGRVLGSQSEGEKLDYRGSKTWEEYSGCRGAFLDSCTLIKISYLCFDALRTSGDSDYPVILIPVPVTTLQK